MCICAWLIGEIIVWKKKNILQSVPRNVYLNYCWKTCLNRTYYKLFVISCSWVSDFKVVCQYCPERSVPRYELLLKNMSVPANVYMYLEYWWNNCFGEKTFYHLYQGMYRCAWIIDEIPVWTIHHIFLRQFFLLFYVRWVKMRADCSLCWYWWNYLPSLF